MLLYDKSLSRCACWRTQASEAYKAALSKAKVAPDGSTESILSVETHTDGVTSLMVAAVGGHMVSPI